MGTEVEIPSGERAPAAWAGQTCRVCGCRDKFSFDVPDDVWRAVVPPGENGVVCLSCFDDFARERGVDYSKAIMTLYFAGEGSCFEFRRVWGVPTDGRSR